MSTGMHFQWSVNWQQSSRRWFLHLLKPPACLLSLLWYEDPLIQQHLLPNPLPNQRGFDSFCFFWMQVVGCRVCVAETLFPVTVWRGYVASQEVQGTKFDQVETGNGKGLTVKLLFLSFFFACSKTGCPFSLTSRHPV